MELVGRLANDSHAVGDVASGRRRARNTSASGPVGHDVRDMKSARARSSAEAWSPARERRGSEGAAAGGTACASSSSDWRCEACECFNFATRDACYRCARARTASCAAATNWKKGSGPAKCPGQSGPGPSTITSAQSEASGEWALGDWRCAGCAHHNFARRTCCHRCGKPAAASLETTPAAARAASPRALSSSGPAWEEGRGGGGALFPASCAASRLSNLDEQQLQRALALSLADAHPHYTQRDSSMGTSPSGFSPNAPAFSSPVNRAPFEDESEFDPELRLALALSTADAERRLNVAPSRAAVADFEYDDHDHLSAFAQPFQPSFQPNTLPTANSKPHPQPAPPLPPPKMMRKAAMSSKSTQEKAPSKSSSSTFGAQRAHSPHHHHHPGLDQDTLSLLEALGLLCYADSLQRAEIRDMETLAMCNDADLIECGIQSTDARRDLLDWARR